MKSLNRRVTNNMENEQVPNSEGPEGPGGKPFDCRSALPPPGFFYYPGFHCPGFHHPGFGLPGFGLPGFGLPGFGLPGFLSPPPGFPSPPPVFFGPQPVFFSTQHSEEPEGLEGPEGSEEPEPEGPEEAGDTYEPEILAMMVPMDFDGVPIPPNEIAEKINRGKEIIIKEIRVPPPALRIMQYFGEKQYPICPFCRAYENLFVNEEGKMVGLLCDSCRMKVAESTRCIKCEKHPLTIGPLGNPLRQICSYCIKELQDEHPCRCGNPVFIDPQTGCAAAMCNGCAKRSAKRSNKKR